TGTVHVWSSKPANVDAYFFRVSDTGAWSIVQSGTRRWTRSMRRAERIHQLCSDHRLHAPMLATGPALAADLPTVRGGDRPGSRSTPGSRLLVRTRGAPGRKSSGDRLRGGSGSGPADRAGARGRRRAPFGFR